MVAILHKQLNLPGTLHRTLQLLSVHPFEKVPLHKLFTESEFKMPSAKNVNQLLLLDLCPDARGLSLKSYCFAWVAVLEPV
jgi:hypothetical protein